MGASKTGRKAAQAAAAMGQSTKAVISDEQYVKNLRDDLANARYVSQEGARALLRVYDIAKSELSLAISANEGLASRNTHLEKAVFDNVDLQVKLGEALITSDRWRDEAVVAEKQRDVLSGKYDRLTSFLAQEIKASPQGDEDAIDSAIRLIRSTHTAKAAENRAIAEAPYADELTVSDEVREKYARLASEGPQAHS